MRKVNYVLLKFADNDFRVYAKRVATKGVLKGWNEISDTVKVEVVTEGTDKDVLIAMAKIAREAFLAQYPEEGDTVDRTDFGAQFP